MCRTESSPESTLSSPGTVRVTRGTLLNKKYEYHSCRNRVGSLTTHIYRTVYRLRDLVRHEGVSNSTVVDWFLKGKEPGSKRVPVLLAQVF